MFWDIRAQGTPLARLVEAHSADINQVIFHPTNPMHVISGSIDGLVNVFSLDLLAEADPENSVIHTLNSESAVSKVGYFGPNSEYLFCLTCIETFILWHGLPLADEEQSGCQSFS